MSFFAIDFKSILCIVFNFYSPQCRIPCVHESAWRLHGPGPNYGFWHRPPLTTSVTASSPPPPPACTCSIGSPTASTRVTSSPSWWSTRSAGAVVGQIATPWTSTTPPADWWCCMLARGTSCLWGRTLRGIALVKSWASMTITGPLSVDGCWSNQY